MPVNKTATIRAAKQAAKVRVANTWTWLTPDRTVFIVFSPRDGRHHGTRQPKVQANTAPGDCHDTARQIAIGMFLPPASSQQRFWCKMLTFQTVSGIPAMKTASAIHMAFAAAQNHPTWAVRVAKAIGLQPE